MAMVEEEVEEPELVPVRVHKRVLVALHQVAVVDMEEVVEEAADSAEAVVLELVEALELELVEAEEIHSFPEAVVCLSDYKNKSALVVVAVALVEKVTLD